MYIHVALSTSSDCSLVTLTMPFEVISKELGVVF